MLKGIIMTTAAIAVIAAGSLASVGALASTVAKHHKANHRHVTQQASDITSFSSSSAGLHVGVNHPPKK